MAPGDLSCSDPTITTNNQQTPAKAAFATCWLASSEQLTRPGLLNVQHLPERPAMHLAVS